MTNVAMTPERLAEIRARAEAAAPGPWEVDVDARQVFGATFVQCVNGSQPAVATVSVFLREMDATGAFIAAARTDIPDLCDEVDRLRALLQRCIDEHDAAHAGSPEGLSYQLAKDIRAAGIE